MERRTPQGALSLCSSSLQDNLAQNPAQNPAQNSADSCSEMLPYLCINPQRRLDALVSRSVFYEIAERAEYDERENLFFVRSGEDRFALTASDPPSDD